MRAPTGGCSARWSGTLGLTLPEILAPIRSVPRHPLALARFGLAGLLPATWLARRFRTEEARALLAGVAAHSMLPLSAPVTSAFGLVLMMAAHAVGWPVVEGGSGRLGAMPWWLSCRAGWRGRDRVVGVSLDEPAPGPGRAARRHPPPAARAGRGPAAAGPHRAALHGSGTGRGCARWTGR